MATKLNTNEGNCRPALAAARGCWQWQRDAMMCLHLKFKLARRPSSFRGRPLRTVTVISSTDETEKVFMMNRRSDGSQRIERLVILSHVTACYTVLVL